MNSPDPSRTSPITSIRTSSKCSPWTASQVTASQAQPGALTVIDGLQGAAVPDARAGLDLADDQDPAFESHDVELAGLAPPVPVEDPQPGPFQVLRGGLLAPAAQLVLVPHLAPPPVMTVPEREAPRWPSWRAVDDGARNGMLWTVMADLSVPRA